MKTLEQTFHELTALISDQSRDLAMAELASVAAERDKLKAELSDACRKINSLSIALDTERITARHAKAESGTARQSLRAAEQEVAEMEADYADLRTVNARLVADLAAAMERADTAGAVEIDTLCNDFRRANTLLAAELAAAMQRADTAGAILRAKA